MTSAYEVQEFNSSCCICLFVLFQPAAKSRGLGLDLEFMFDPKAARPWVDVNEIEVSKLLRACGGCLGTERR